MDIIMIQVPGTQRMAWHRIGIDYGGILCKPFHPAAIPLQAAFNLQSIKPRVTFHQFFGL